MSYGKREYGIKRWMDKQIERKVVDEWKGI